ncbi:protoporphyrinogen oxidase [Bacillus carboniphilus]|uniref:Coproporphyrinogen III oxidase n=1 Tax=Bacillus carboniphilus TaxID=86663 RepID=A0ABP3GA30_9BACI
MKTVLVIGGGITGLSTMFKLHKWKKETQTDVKLILAEASSNLGGKIRTVKEQGFIMEAGADSIVSRKAQSMTFIEELGLDSELVYNATGRSFIYTNGQLKPIPSDAVFGIPMSVESLAKTTLVSAEGKVEALKDLYTPNETFSKEDSVGEFLEYFFGQEFVGKQIAPVLSGVYSGKLSDLTIASTLPYLIDYKDKYGSIIKGFEANKEKFQSGSGKKFFSFKNGLSTLIDAYEKQMEGAEIYKDFQADRLEKVGDGYRVAFSNGESIEADHVILSVPHTVTEKLLDEADLSSEFAQFKSSSLISVYVAFDVPDSILPEEGTGFITANTDELSCNACTWTSRKWEHTSESGNLLVRLFYKSSHPSYERLKEMGEEKLLEVALQDVKKSLGIEATPTTSEVTKWIDNMPNYQITHPKTVASIEEKLAKSYPGVWIAGCSYYGVGIPDCIENGETTAKKVISQL